MSKAIRIREHLYEEIQRLARKERRSLIAQLEILLEQALKLEARKPVGETIARPPLDAQGLSLDTEKGKADV